MARIDEVVIIGGGLAGLFCALKLAPRPVTIITADPVGENASSVWAQGGVAAAIGEGDSPEKHLHDTIVAGDGLVERGIGEIMTREASRRIFELLDFGVPFDTDSNGQLILSREAAHGVHRIVRVGGDCAGQAIMSTLDRVVRQEPRIKIYAGYEVEALHCNNNQLAAITVRSVNGGGIERIPVQAAVLATGGVGHLYSLTTNPPRANGSGIAMAARAGGIVADCEFVQFHPTAMNIGKDPAPLATEALRGEGALLVDNHGHRFMADIHQDGELAPRDVVARAVYRQMTSKQGAFLDCRRAPGEKIITRFPTVYNACCKVGIDPVTQPIPIVPAAHYFMGGVLIDANGRSSINGLWACGEVSSSGVHGANRLASNSLLEALVFAARVAEDINGLIIAGNRVVTMAINDDLPLSLTMPEHDTDQKLRRLMTTMVGVERSPEDLVRAIIAINTIGQRAISRRLRDMSIVAQLIAVSAYLRQESRGCHFRTDYRHSIKAWEHRSFTTLAKVKKQAAEITESM